VEPGNGAQSHPIATSKKASPALKPGRPSGDVMATGERLKLKDITVIARCRLPETKKYEFLLRAAIAPLISASVPQSSCLPN
jgi:hypothetical protein